MCDLDLERETFLNCKDSIYYQLYKKHQRAHWTPEEVDLSKDINGFNQLPKEEQLFIQKISTFFLISDGVVSDNVQLIATCMERRDIKAFYAFQDAMENVHIEAYGNIFSKVFDCFDLKKAVDEIKKMPSVLLKREFCLKDYGIMDDKKNQAKLILSNILIEGVFFAASFSGILWLKKRGKCPGIVKTNEWILRDERLHWIFGCEIFKDFYSNYLDTAEIYNMVENVFTIESCFIDDILLCDLGDITKTSLLDYVKFCCNEILTHINVEPYFENVNQPFEFMKFLNFPDKANFFENRPTAYALPENSSRFDYNNENKYVYNPPTP